MKRLLSPLAALLFSAGALSAQTTPMPLADSTRVSEECMLGMQEQEWSALGLSAAQIEQVQGVQTDCKTDCVAHKETGSPDPAMSRALLEKHQERIGKVLDKQQYDKWIAFCKQRAGDTRLMK